MTDIFDPITLAATAATIAAAVWIGHRADLARGHACRAGAAAGCLRRRGPRHHR